MTRACLTLVVAVTLSAREADAQNLRSFDPLKGTYAELVSMYESGHRAEAVRWMTWWPASHFRTGIENLARDTNPRRIKVAIVLHTDVATSADVGRDEAVAQLEIIQPLLDALSDPRRFGGGGDQFVRRCLFLGRPREHDNDFRGAAREYEAALAICPECQTPYVALSLAEERAGDHAKAQEIAARFARLRRSEGFIDPWWLFTFHGIDRDALTWLHEAVQ